MGKGKPNQPRDERGKWTTGAPAQRAEDESGARGALEAMGSFMAPQLSKHGMVNVNSLLATHAPEITNMDKGLPRMTAKRCFNNACEVAMQQVGMDYVEGYTFVHGIPIEHAWNAAKDGGRHVDYTIEDPEGRPYLGLRIPFDVMLQGFTSDTLGVYGGGVLAQLNALHPEKRAVAIQKILAYNGIAQEKEEEGTKAKHDVSNEARDAAGRWTSGINWDANGHGGTPNQVDIDYFGFTKQMTPKEFRSLVPEGNWNTDTIGFVKDAVAKGEAIAPPFLLTKWDEDNKRWLVLDHEGRSRSDASQEMFPDQQIPIHIIPRGLRARHMTDEMKAAPFVAQGKHDAKRYNINEKRDERGRWTLGGVKPIARRKVGSMTTAIAKEVAKLPKNRYGEVSDKAYDWLEANKAILLGKPRSVKMELEDTLDFIRRFGMSPYEMHKGLCASIRLNPSKAKLTVSGEGKDWFLNFKGGGVDCKRDFLGNSVEHAWLTVATPQQNKGLGRKINNYLLGVYDHLGIKEVEVSAGSSGGGYAWARLGFIPFDKEEAEDLMMHCEDRLNDLYAKKEEDDLYYDALEVIKMMRHNPAALIAVAALDTRVKVPNGIKPEGSSTSAKGMKLGAYLLRGSEWNGALTLTDPKAYSVARSYLAGPTRGGKSQCEEPLIDDEEEFDAETQKHFDALVESIMTSAKHDTKNPYWYRQPRQRNGWWGTGNVGPDRKPKGFLRGELDSRPTLHTQSTSYLEGDDGMIACDHLGLRPDQLHRWVETTLGDDPTLNHKDNSLTAFTFNAQEVLGGSDCTTVYYKSHPSTPPDKKTQLTLRVYQPRNGAPAEVHLGFLMLPKDIQGKGIGPRVLGMLSDLADHLEASKITLTANIDIGGYAWARYGFIPSPESWKNTCTHIRKQMAKVAGFSTLTESEATALRGHVKRLTAPNSDPRGIRAIAALDSPCHHATLKDTKFGFALLRGSEWDSEAHMDEADTLDHLRATVEGHEAWTDADYDELAKPITSTGTKSAGGGSALFSMTDHGKRDEHLHREMLPAGSLVADAAGIRMLMKIGLSRADARRYISQSRGYGG